MTFGKIAAFALPVLIGAGCVNLGTEKNAAAESMRATFTPEVKIARSALAAVADSVKIRSFRIMPPCDARSFVRMRKDGQCVTDYYASWIDSPAPLFEAQLENALRDSGLFEKVYDSRVPLQARYLIDAVLTVCRIDERPSRPAAITEMRIILSGNLPRPAANASSSAIDAMSQETLEDVSPREMARGINASLSKTVEALIGKLEKSLPKKTE